MTIILYFINVKNKENDIIGYRTRVIINFFILSLRPSNRVVLDIGLMPELISKLATLRG